MAFQAFPHGHKELILAVDFNLYGDRMVTASSDHCLKVWAYKGDTWQPQDTWKAHDAEVTDVKWNGPYSGNVLASVGDDGYFRVWEEDLLEPLNSRRRFRRVYQMASPTRVPFMSLDFKNINTETVAALATRDGYLVICEPSEGDGFRDWGILQQMYVAPTPPPQEETSFRVCFHHEKLPAWTACAAGLDRKSISLCVAAMDQIRIYRTDKERKFYIAAEILDLNSLIRDVAWSNGAMRGFDTIAVATKDGNVHVYEITTPVPSTNTADGAGKGRPGVYGEKSSSRSTTDGQGDQAGARAGLTSSFRSGYQNLGVENQLSRVHHDVKLVAKLRHDYSPIWKVNFSHLGDLLFSSGDDGLVKAWKRATEPGSDEATWLQHSTLHATTESLKAPGARTST